LSEYNIILCGVDAIHTNINKREKTVICGKETIQDNRREKAVLGGALLCLITAAFCLKSDLVDRAVGDSLQLCVQTVVPALFPFMVLNSVWVQSGFAAWLGGKLNGLTGRIFGVSGCGTPFFLGALGGFPLGAECICAMTAKGDCSREEAERMLAFCSNTGPSFLIAGVGGAMFGSTKTGLILYISQLLSAVLTGYIFCRIFGKLPMRRGINNPVFFSGNMLVSAISGAAVSLLKICGFVTAFGVITALVGNAAGGLPDALRALLYGSLELTSGAVQAARAGGLAGVTVCGAICGWAGLSVHLQTMSAVREQGLQLGYYYRGKLLQSLLCAGFTLIFCKFF